MVKQYTYRLAESTKEDFMKIQELDYKLTLSLNPQAKIPTEKELKKRFKYFKNLHNKIDEFFILCEIDGEAIGYCQIGTYAILNDKRHNDVGNIIAIYVDKGHRSIVLSFTLFQKALTLLQEHGINQAIMNVQTHNEFRFLHYAICDEVISSEKYTRKDGTNSCNKLLAINDISALMTKSWRDIAREATTHRKNFEENGIELE